MKNITRHITTFCFFACLCFVLVINGGKANIPDYDQFRTSVETTNLDIRKISKKEQQRLYTFATPEYNERYGPYIQKMRYMTGKTDSLYQYLEQLKTAVGTKTGGNRQGKNVQQFITQNHLDSLNRLMQQTFSSVIGTVNESDRPHFEKTGVQYWTQIPEIRRIASFRELRTILALYQNALILNEYVITRQLLSEAIGIVCYFDETACIAVPEQTFAFPGQEVKASMFLATYNRSLNPEISASNGRIKIVEDGVASWEQKEVSLGLNKITGTASIDLGGKVTARPFSFSYFVAAPGISANLDKANICYVGVDNPITMSVPGYENDQLSLTVNGATATKTSDGRFNIYFGRIPEEKTYAFVHATNEADETSIVASLLLSVKVLPHPIAAIADISNGDIGLHKFRNAEGLSILRKDDFDMEYSIVSYRLSLLHNGNREYIEPVKGKGAHFAKNPGIAKILHTATRGDRAFFEEITVRDRQGKLIQLAPIILRIY